MKINKVSVEEFARNNIGKSFITFDKDYRIREGIEAMIVGYNSYHNFLICSIDELDGWRNLWENDILIIHSPLNISYYYMTVEEIKDKLL